MFFTVLTICLVIGCLVGFLAGLLGIGGGLIIVPALVFILPKLGISTDVVMQMALATSLASIVVTSFIAGLSHHKNGNVPWKLARNLSVFVSVGALSGGFIADSLSVDMLTNIFAAAVISLALYMLISLRITQNVGKQPSLRKQRAIGLGTGIVASLMGISGGAILIPVLTYCNVQLRHAIGVSTVCGLLISAFGALGFIVAGLDQSALPQWTLGYVYLPALLGIVITSSMMAPLGVKFAGKLPTRTIAKLFSAFLIIVALKMILN